MKYSGCQISCLLRYSGKVKKTARPQVYDPAVFKKILQRLNSCSGLGYLIVIFQNIIRMIDFLHHPQHVADIHVNSG